MTQEADRTPAQAGSGGGRRAGAARAARKPQGRPSLGGGTPAQDRELRAQGQETVRKLLEAGMVEFDERGFNGVRVDDVVKRAGISHGTFYLYFSNKDDLFKTLLRDALDDMEIVTGDFPVVTRNDGGCGTAGLGARASATPTRRTRRSPHAQPADVVAARRSTGRLQMLFG